jgi:hypothetical protein
VIDLTKESRGFLDLPPELRNKIYQLALKERTGRIAVDTTWKPPALLATCKQIRSESRCMAYVVNSFGLAVRDCDHSVRMAFKAHLQSLPDELRNQVTCYTTLAGSNWNNLVVWCRHVWNGDAHPLHKRANAGKLWTIVYGATNIARHAHGSWKDCELQLEAFREVAGKLDGIWLQ